MTLPLVGWWAVGAGKCGQRSLPCSQISHQWPGSSEVFLQESQQSRKGSAQLGDGAALCQQSCAPGRAAVGNLERMLFWGFLGCHWWKSGSHPSATELAFPPFLPGHFLEGKLRCRLEPDSWVGISALTILNHTPVPQFFHP